MRMKTNRLLSKIVIVVVLFLLSSQSFSQTFTSSIEWGNGRYNGDVTIRSLKRVPHGSGTYEDYSGNRYVGKWSEGKKNGQGVYYLAKGDKIVGNWVKGNLQGKAKYYFASGSVSEVVYKDGKPISKKTISRARTATKGRTTQRKVSRKDNYTPSSSKTSSTSTSTTYSPARTVVQQRQPQPVQVWEDCWVCHGDGRCSICHGERYNYSGREYYTCGGCNGSGRCSTCNGRRGQYRTEYR